MCALDLFNQASIAARQGLGCCICGFLSVSVVVVLVPLTSLEAHRRLTVRPVCSQSKIHKGDRFHGFRV